jgi:hypothetical protein
MGGADQSERGVVGLIGDVGISTALKVGALGESTVIVWTASAPASSSLRCAKMVVVEAIVRSSAGGIRTARTGPTEP